MPPKPSHEGPMPPSSSVSGLIDALIPPKESTRPVIRSAMQRRSMKQFCEGIQYLGTKTATQAIYPHIEAMPQDQLCADDTLSRERNQAEAWTERFILAAFAHIVPSNPPSTMDLIELDAQNTLVVGISGGKTPYTRAIIEARLSLLFPIALSLHEGGTTVYPIDLPAVREALSGGPQFFAGRLNIIESHLRKHKSVVNDLIEERGTYIFVANPRRAVEARTEESRRGRAKTEGK